MTCFEKASPCTLTPGSVSRNFVRSAAEGLLKKREARSEVVQTADASLREVAVLVHLSVYFPYTTLAEAKTHKAL